jgi:hypothetical protein
MHQQVDNRQLDGQSTGASQQKEDAAQPDSNEDFTQTRALQSHQAVEEQAPAHSQGPFADINGVLQEEGVDCTRKL